MTGISEGAVGEKKRSQAEKGRERQKEKGIVTKEREG